MSQNFQTGDYLIFQIEAAFGLLRILEMEEAESGTIWHLAAYEDMFLDIEMAEAALQNPATLEIGLPHVALTNRAFAATQTSRLINAPLKDDELKPLLDWKNDRGREISDRSIRLLLGLR